MKSVFLLSVVMAVFAAVGAAKLDKSCGMVLDGLAWGQFDLQTQTSTSTIAAHWKVPGDVLHYEYAVISSVLKPFMHTEDKCGKFVALPNIVEWTSARQATSFTLNNVKLTVGETYYVLIRASMRDGGQRILWSDGVEVVAADDPVVPPTKQIKVQKVQAKVENQCLIDIENTCRAGRVSVGEYLTETYGEPLFDERTGLDHQILEGSPAARARAGLYVDNAYARQYDRDFEGIGLVVQSEDLVREVFVESGGDDDDEDSPRGRVPVWVIAPVAGALLLLALLILVVLVVVRIATAGDDYNEGQSRPASFAAGATADDDEGKDYSLRKGAAVGSADTTTTVDFPDTNIRRLSISHENDEAADALEEATKSPRRKHPIMQSASSSFRDYNAE